jgi:hypothetical protein
MYVMGMTCNFINIYRFEGRIAVPSGIIMQLDGHIAASNVKWPEYEPEGNYIWRDLNGDGHHQANEFFDNLQRDSRGPVWIDRNGDVWLASGLYRYEYQGLDSIGNPIYSVDKCTQMPRPDGVNNPLRVVYDSERDILVTAEKGKDNFQMSAIHICKDYMKGGRQTVSFNSGAGGDAGCLAVAGDYVFSAGWEQRSKVYINKISDGSEVGVLIAGPEVGGDEACGWVDIMMGINAFQRSTGEYVILLEDDYRAKSVMYRWVPDGVTLKPETPVGQVTGGPIPATRPDRNCVLNDLMGRVVASGKANNVNKGVRPGVYISIDENGKLSRSLRHFVVFKCRE